MTEPFEPPSREAPSVSVEALAWTAAVAVFLAIRLGALLNLPVAGAELVHLSGAWQARIGVEDDRFAATLFQALSALFLEGSTSEVPARLLAFAATATIPGALWLLRPVLGRSGALLTLIIFAFDAPAVVLGATATAMGFDLALVVWLATIVLREWRLKWGWAAVAFGCACSGPLTLPLLLALAIREATRRTRPGRTMVLALAAGTAAGVLATSLRFGFGWDGLRVAPFDLFAASYEERWSSATTLALSFVYLWPAFALGLGALGWRLYRWYDHTEAFEPVAIGWPVFAIAWWLTDLTGHGGVAATAVTVPLALLTGPAIVRAWPIARRADWRVAGMALAFGALLAGMAIAVVLDWAERGQTGPASEVARVALFSGAGVMLVGLVATMPAARRALLVIPAAGLFLLASAAINIAFVPADDSLPSPFVPDQARALRDIAISRAAANGGEIVIHPDFAQALTWPFRDSGDVLVASRVPPGAAVVLWPAALPRPEGFDVLEGNWALTRERLSPTRDPLDYLHWLFDRNTLRAAASTMTVYVKGSE